MKIATLVPIASLIAAGCAQPARTDGEAADTPSGGVTASGSMPHERTGGDGHRGAMDMAAMTPQPGDSAATKGSKQAMMKMMQGMPPYIGNPDVDFNTQMRGHHIAAIDMAEVQLAHGRDPESRALAAKIIADQKREVAQIDAWLRKRGQ